MKRHTRQFILIIAIVLVVPMTFSGCFLGDIGVDNPNYTPTEPTPKLTNPPTNTPKVTPEPTAEPTPEPTPTVEPTPTPDMLDGAPVLLRYDTEWPENVEFDLKYDKYSTYPSYFVALKSANIREKPTTKSKVISGLSFGRRVQLTASVQVGSKVWYRVQWTRKGKEYTGYMHQATGSPRVFQVDKMIDRAQKLQHTMDSGNAVFVRNYKNSKGSAPLLNGKTYDKHGYRRYQSAPGYEKPDAESKFRYIPDGMLGVVQGEEHGYKKVYVPSFDQTVWIPTKYLSKDEDAIEALTQVIVVDRENQNMGVLEWIDNQWKIVSLTFCSTGKSGQYSLPTPLGDYMAQQRRFKFQYYHDGTTDIAGYAPYTIRFSAGGYIHGVPRVYKVDEETGEKIDPGMAEALSSLGTTPRSHMCVRNYTSHAKFLYNWVDVGSCAVIVIE